MKKEIKSIRLAAEGIVSFLIKEDHAKIHLMATLIVVLLMFYLPTTNTEKALLCICICLVWATEMINSSVEKTLDLYTTHFNAGIKYIKDVMAGAVLITSICAICIGSIILLPKIIDYVF